MSIIRVFTLCALAFLNSCSHNTKESITPSPTVAPLPSATALPSTTPAPSATPVPSPTAPKKSYTWASPPLSAPFKVFKMFEEVPSPEKHLIIFSKRTVPFYKLTQRLNGDSTLICYGTMITHPDETYVAVACPKSEMNEKSCATVDVKKCAENNSILPTRAGSHL